MNKEQLIKFCETAIITKERDNKEKFHCFNEETEVFILIDDFFGELKPSEWCRTNKINQTNEFNDKGHILTVLDASKKRLAQNIIQQLKKR